MVFGFRLFFVTEVTFSFSANLWSWKGKRRVDPERRTEIQRQRSCLRNDPVLRGLIFLVCIAMVLMNSIQSPSVVIPTCPLDKINMSPLNIDLISGVTSTMQIQVYGFQRGAAQPSLCLPAWLTSLSPTLIVYVYVWPGLCIQKGKTETLRVGYSWLLMTRGITFWGANFL